MEIITYLLYTISAYRLKYPAHNYHSPCPGQSSLDLTVRGLFFILASIQYEQRNEFWWIPISFGILPTFPWFIILQATQSGILSIPCALLSTYGLLQPPWQHSKIYKLQILISALSTVYLNTSNLFPQS